MLHEELGPQCRAIVSTCPLGHHMPPLPPETITYPGPHQMFCQRFCLEGKQLCELRRVCIMPQVSHILEEGCK